MFLLKVVESSKPDAWAHNETYCPCLHGSGMQCENFPISFSIKKKTEVIREEQEKEFFNTKRERIKNQTNKHRKNLQRNQST